MTKILIKQLMAIATLLGVMFVGIGGLLSPPVIRARHEWVPDKLSDLAYHLENIGNFFIIIAPVILIIVDWRNIFPLVKRPKNRTGSTDTDKI